MVMQRTSGEVPKLHFLVRRGVEFISGIIIKSNWVKLSARCMEIAIERLWLSQLQPEKVLS